MDVMTETTHRAQEHESEVVFITTNQLQYFALPKPPFSNIMPILRNTRP